MNNLALKFAYAISSARFTAALLFYCVVFIFLATLQIPSLGIAQVQSEYFMSWGCMWGHLPLLGGKSAGVLILANLVASSFRFCRRGAAGFGFAMIHIGLGLLIISAFMQDLWRKEGGISLEEGVPANKVAIYDSSNVLKESISLPFTVELQKFSMENWKNTDVASTYSSHVKFKYKDIVREKLIKMNEPASFGSWTFYQFSYADGGRVSVLQAVRNPAGLLPWVAVLLVFLGMIYAYAYKIFERR